MQFASKVAKIGMAMALSLFWAEGSLTLITGFENGHAMVARLRTRGSWDVVYKAQSHSQPILSLDVAPDKTYFLTSGADAVIAKHPIPSPNTNLSAQKKPAVNNVQSSQPEAESSTSAEPVRAAASSPPPPPSGTPTSLLSAALAGESNKSPPKTPITSTKRAAEPTMGPIKTVNTKHAGQQGLRARRADGKVFATAGWDGRVRVYSARTLAELAVLRWHDVGCYAVAFADVDGGVEAEGAARDGPGTEGLEERGKDKEKEEASGGEKEETEGEAMQSAVTSRMPDAELTVKDRRIRMAKEAHWLAAGSKDGRISLWDIY